MLYVLVFLIGGSLGAFIMALIVGGVLTTETKKKKRKRAATQLCWSCSMNASNCAWMRCYKPIEGWTAKETKVKNSGFQNPDETIPSYEIKKCPNYVKENRKGSSAETADNGNTCKNCGKKLTGWKQFCNSHCNAAYRYKQKKEARNEIQKNNLYIS